MIYRPVGLATSVFFNAVLGGFLAAIVFKQYWKPDAPRNEAAPQKALNNHYPIGVVLLAGSAMGAIFALVKIVIDRQATQLFERWGLLHE